MKTKIVGLTGGIGSGKTTIAQYFIAMGVPVYFADDEAKKILYAPDTVAEVTNAFGEEVLTNGVPDRQKIAAIVFNNPQKLEVLNGIIHPKVRQHFKDWVAAHDNEPLVIKETAILFESGSYKDCDATILVTAPKEVRIQRVMGRDNTTAEKVLERMANQWDDERKIPLSNYIIQNINSIKAEKEAQKVLEIIQKTEY
ncbi:dephospho-CoA kinase [Flavobacterium album]|uniref:Dephospho-CoA kinase n=1 Tax=Flavobacterium album TaxID=2175091 RepID=A0A2S1QYZ2_9FLAO|nr:dephospho-CoA kinase [Flavobacterium album]AWH85636.1 dephospho-CoA kinase [Flavobacterium album]